MAYNASVSSNGEVKALIAKTPWSNDKNLLFAGRIIKPEKEHGQGEK
jgi:hypothetical protein